MNIKTSSLPSCPKLNRVPDGEVKLEPVENGELLAESCNPLMECERSQSRASSGRSCGEGVYLQESITGTPINKSLVKINVTTFGIIDSRY